MSSNMDVIAQDNLEESPVEYFIRSGISYEEHGNSSKAIENYIKAIDCINETTTDHIKFDIYIRLGDIYQLTGKIDDGLIQFQNAYEISRVNDNKIFKVDALLRIANNYLYKNEVNNGTKYAEEADKILIELDYIKGKLESGIFWARYFYLSQDKFKAREKCINALKLCGDDYFIEKGKILNLFAELSSNLVSDEEYLSILRQAYECFEKGKYERGMLGVLNNIGHVYDSKMQNYEKALECFLLLKQKSENSIFLEISFLACVNIGEIYFKLLRYDEALKWFKEAESRPVGSYPENAKVYVFTFIANTYLKMCNYNEAYNYFIFAGKGIISKNIKGSSLICYYNLAAALFDEFGKSEEAAIYMEKAIKAAESEQSLLKWETGIMYELIKLKQAKNETDMLGVLEGVRHLIAQFKNTNSILDIVCNFYLQIIGIGYKDLGFKLFEEFKNTESDLEIINLKKTYLKVISEDKSTKKVETLKLLLNQSLKLKDYKMIIKIYNSLGDSYLVEERYEDAIISYQNACDCINELALNAPSEFKNEIEKANCLDDALLKLAKVKQLKV
jgi:tetratricopeptide (TPR) repeat protein